ncbi:glycine-rich domain-containing protein 1 [Humulus lupulus]|uniref:glycine-rich domain-containing protein 1 n=1 Tax=Humulus lupulus TaxID=3486 RepID=UPI002B40AC50|nr:glycine-rich domain-containing protein 1 [Humulus lupulus]XP_062100871.1 glycine-rich domain-containing protein 1 [Humulus lupulus]
MAMEQELEWIEAQNIGISVDLVAVAKRQLQFLAAVDRNRSLYDGPVLNRAIYRYNACWLPLLAKHSEAPVSKGPLVVPLDCEWIWHCHRLNPVQYKSDCEELYGRILDNCNVVSSVDKSCKRETEEIWKSLYPEEPYTLDLNLALSEDISERVYVLEKCTKYDLVSAAKRQTPFFYQVSRPHMNNDLFLEGALARYKGFLHLIRRNKEKSLKRFCVPTYDIDLIWHSHQLHPVSYSKDLNEVLGKVLEHDDTDSDRTKGTKLDVGFSSTTKQWEETFGTRYWRAGAMYRGSTPTPVTNTPCSPNMINKEKVKTNECQKIIQLPEVKFVEVVLEFVEVKNLPEGHKGSLFVTFSKTQPDILFDAKRKLTILSEAKEKQVASFQCEPNGELLFELVSRSPSNLPITKPLKTLGTTSLSLQDLSVSASNLSVEKWLDLVPSSGNVSSKPIRLRVAVSSTVPAPAQCVLEMVHSRQLLKNSCFPISGKTKDATGRIHVIDETGTKLINLQIRNIERAKARENSYARKEVIGMMKSGEMHTLAEFIGTGWSLMNCQWSLHPCKKSSGDCCIFELVGDKMVKFYPGRKLDYEPKHCEKHKNEKDFITAVEFSAEDPYGKAVALLNLKSGFVKVKEEWMLIPSVISFSIFSDTVNERYDGFAVNAKNLELKNITEISNDTNKEANGTDSIPSATSEVKFNMVVAERDALVPRKGELSIGGCGAGCGSGCGNMVRSGGQCENMVKSGGCGSSGCGGCGAGGCGAMVSSGGGCGSGCGGGCGGCGAMVSSDGCGGCGAGGCGNMVSSGGCGGCGAGGCGSMVSSGGCGGCGGGANFAQSDNPCADALSKGTPTPQVNEAVAA